MRSFRECVRIRTVFIKTATPVPVHVFNRIIESYVKNSSIKDARKLFDEMTDKNMFTRNTMINGYLIENNLLEARRLFESDIMRDTVSYNSMISGYVRNLWVEEAVALFREMKDCEVEMDGFTFTAMLNLSANSLGLSCGKQIHSFLIKTGISSNFLCSSIVDMYSKCGGIDDAERIFNETCDGDLVASNAMVATYFRHGELQLGLKLFREMCTRNVVSWNTLLWGYIHNGRAEKALEAFIQMSESGVCPNEHTYACILSSSACLRIVRAAKLIHAKVLRNGFISNPFVASNLVDAYCKCDDLQYAGSVNNEMWHQNAYSVTSLIVSHANTGNLDEAHRLFNLLREKNVVAWTALITGHVRFQQSDMALALFKLFNEERTATTDELLIISVLGACALQANLESGKQIHGYTIRKQVHMGEKLGNAILDMYAKCGNVQYAEVVFKQVDARDLVLYNTMMYGYANHSREVDAMNLFDYMLQEGIKPDQVTFTALLSACRHAGLTEKGESFFKSMITDHGLSPEMDHYACMVDLYVRSNSADKAEALIKSITPEPDASIWGAYLNSCKNHGNGKFSVDVEHKILSLESENGSRYVHLANFYASEGMWDEMGRIRRKMRGKEVKKMAGCSWIFVENQVFSFTSGDRFCLAPHTVHATLHSLNNEMKRAWNLIQGHETLKERKGHIT